MRNFKAFIITVIAGCMAGFGFSSCGGDDDGGGTDANSYKVEVAFGSGAENYFKQVSLGGATSDGKIAAVKDASGKELTTPSLNDGNYTFSSNNTFELMDKVAAFSVVVNVTHHGTTQHDPLTVKTKIYKGGKLAYEDDATATPDQSYMLSKQF
jgi:hypothetical protein